MREPHRHRVWNQRWRSLWQNPPQPRVHHGRTDAGKEELGPWNARLREDLHLTTVVLGGSPDGEEGRQELQSALRAGIPVILWDHRPGALASDMAQLLGSVTAGPPGELIDRVHELRHNAGLLASDAQNRHPGRHLAVLWDDPDRNVYDTGAQP